MNWNSWVRQSHRVLAVVFTLAVIGNFVVMGYEQIALWVGMLTLIPLFLLLFTGLYLFALPWVTKWRGRGGG